MKANITAFRSQILKIVIISPVYTFQAIKTAAQAVPGISLVTPKNVQKSLTFYKSHLFFGRWKHVIVILFFCFSRHFLRSDTLKILFDPIMAENGQCSRFFRYASAKIWFLNPIRSVSGPIRFLLLFAWRFKDEHRCQWLFPLLIFKKRYFIHHFCASRRSNEDFMTKISSFAD